MTALNKVYRRRKMKKGSFAKCLFCKQKAHLFIETEYIKNTKLADNYGSFVVCRYCGARGPIAFSPIRGEAMFHALSTWNRRTIWIRGKYKEKIKLLLLPLLMTGFWGCQDLDNPPIRCVEYKTVVQAGYRAPGRIPVAKNLYLVRKCVKYEITKTDGTNNEN